MTILWLNWKDITHPQAGGAETVNHEIMKRLVRDGHSVTLLTSSFSGSSTNDSIDGVTVLRVGSNRYLHSFQAVFHYLRQLRNQFDIIIECVNTAPYLLQYVKGSERLALFYHQLAREIWFHETRAPLNWIGYWLLEPVATWLQSRGKLPVITVSKSTKNDLVKFGFRAENIYVISEGITLKPLPSLSHPYEGGVKYPQPTILAFGALRSMKRTDHILKAFEFVKHQNTGSPDHLITNLKLIIAGDTSGACGKKILTMVERSAFKNDIQVLGRVPHEQKIALLRSSHVLAVTSLKEGWCLVVTEAASQGTPAVVYNVDGLRDSVKHDETGLICEENTPECLAKNIIELLQDKEKYERLRTAAWQWSKEINFDKSYQEFKQAINV